MKPLLIGIDAGTSSLKAVLVTEDGNVLAKSEQRYSLTYSAPGHDCVASVMRPVKQLVAFQRVTLAAGETKDVCITIDPSELALITEDEKRVIEPGEFTLMVGHSSKAEDLLSLTFQLGMEP